MAFTIPMMQTGESIGLSWQFLISKMLCFSRKVRKIGEDDPRRIAHSLKVGLALTLVSTLYYVNPMFKGFGDSATWAVITVVLVMEFTVGAALTKGLNRTCGTFLAGVLGVGIHRLAILFGEKGEPIALALFVFLVAMVATFARFIPELKARYDYGVLIFILTFCLVTVSSFREDVVVLAQERIATICIGVVISYITTILVFPIWAGEDLHRLEAANLEKLASFLQGLGDDYFGEDVSNETLEGKPSLQGYKSVLNSKPTEDTLANFAKWEPGHGRFRFRHPWGRYLEIGAESRRCANHMESLNAYVTKTLFKVANESELHKNLRVACMELSSESSKALNELASAIRSMETPAAANRHITLASLAADQLKTSISENCIITQILHAVTVVSLLVEIVGCVQQIAASVEELARLAHFKGSEEIDHKANEKPLVDVEGLC